MKNYQIWLGDTLCTNYAVPQTCAKLVNWGIKHMSELFDNKLFSSVYIKFSMKLIIQHFQIRSLLYAKSEPPRLPTLILRSVVLVQRLPMLNNLATSWSTPAERKAVWMKRADGDK